LDRPGVLFPSPYSEYSGAEKGEKRKERGGEKVRQEEGAVRDDTPVTATLIWVNAEVRGGGKGGGGRGKKKRDSTEGLGAI